MHRFCFSHLKSLQPSSSARSHNSEQERTQLAVTDLAPFLCNFRITSESELRFSLALALTILKNAT